MIAVQDTRCYSYCEVIPEHHKRCIRPHEHIEQSHLWVEDIRRSDGPPRIVVWSDNPPKVIYGHIADMITEEK